MLSTQLNEFSLHRSAIFSLKLLTVAAEILLSRAIHDIVAMEILLLRGTLEIVAVKVRLSRATLEIVAAKIRLQRATLEIKISILAA